MINQLLNLIHQLNCLSAKLLRVMSSSKNAIWQNSMSSTFPVAESGFWGHYPTYWGLTFSFWALEVPLPIVRKMPLSLSPSSLFNTKTTLLYHAGRIQHSWGSLWNFEIGSSVGLKVRPDNHHSSKKYWLMSKASCFRSAVKLDQPNATNIIITGAFPKLGMKFFWGQFAVQFLNWGGNPKPSIFLGEKRSAQWGLHLWRTKSENSIWKTLSP